MYDKKDFNVHVNITGLLLMKYIYIYMPIYNYKYFYVIGNIANRDGIIVCSAISISHQHVIWI